MALILASLVLLALAAPLLALHYLTRLPDAPVCPACRRVTHGVPGSGGRALARVWLLLPATEVRRCTACGWEGRMRWRWAVQGEGEGQR